MTKIKPKVVSPLTVSVQSNGKKRLILDSRLVNEYMNKVSVKYEDNMRTALIFLRKGGYAFKFDLKSGYHHVDICPEHVTYLGFSWEDKGVPSFYMFKQLPFGLSSAPCIYIYIHKNYETSGKKVEGRGKINRSVSRRRYWFCTHFQKIFIAQGLSQMSRRVSGYQQSRLTG